MLMDCRGATDAAQVARGVSLSAPLLLRHITRRRSHKAPKRVGILIFMKSIK